MVKYRDSLNLNHPIVSRISGDHLWTFRQIEPPPNLIRYDRICETCVQDHSFRPIFVYVKTSIDTIPELCHKLKTWESMIRTDP
jgi:hypothetical protein